MTKGAELAEQTGRTLGYTSRMRGQSSEARRIQRIFSTLEAAMGPQHWWPAGSAFEVVVGAYLTQNTAWTNVQQAMENLRGAGVLTISGIRTAALDELERLVRPSGYYRQKAARLKRFVGHLDEGYGGSLEALFGRPLEALREELLGLTGIGPETADSILLYAAGREVFVVDSYTRRIFERHGLAHEGSGYEEIRAGVETALAGEGSRPQLRKPEVDEDGTPAVAARAIPALAVHAPSAASTMGRSSLSQRYNEFHALLVQTGKHFCLKGVPRCQSCPLRSLLPPQRRSNG